MVAVIITIIIIIISSSYSAIDGTSGGRVVGSCCRANGRTGERMDGRSFFLPIRVENERARGCKD